MSETLYEKAVKAWPWLFVIGGYVGGVIALMSAWDPPPGGGPPPTLWIFGYLVWLVAYPTAIYSLRERARLEGSDSAQRKPDADD